MNTFYASCPIAKRTQETLFQSIHIGGENKYAEFQRVVVWLLQSESMIRFMHGGIVVRKGPTYNDFNGYLCSFNAEGGALHGAAALAETYAATPNSSMSIEVLATAMLFPCVEPNELVAHNRTKPSSYKSQFAYVPDNWRIKAIEDGKISWPTLQSVVLQQEVIWTSKKTSGQNAELVAQFIRKCTEPINLYKHFPFKEVVA